MPTVWVMGLSNSLDWLLLLFLGSEKSFSKWLEPISQAPLFLVAIVPHLFPRRIDPENVTDRQVVGSIIYI